MISVPPQGPGLPNLGFGLAVFNPATTETVPWAGGWVTVTVTPRGWHALSQKVGRESTRSAPESTVSQIGSGTGWSAKAVSATSRGPVAPPSNNAATMIRYRQQFGFARRHPFARGRALALGTVPVAAAVVGYRRVGAVLAACHVTAEGRCAAVLDGAHHLELVKAHVAAIGMTPRGPVAAEDIRDLQQWPGHGRRALRRR